MNGRQFLAVVILFIGLVVFVLMRNTKSKEREKYERLLNENIRVNISNIKLKGVLEEIKMKKRAAQFGRTMEQQAVADVLYVLEQNGYKDERSGLRVPEWIVKEYKKRYEIE